MTGTRAGHVDLSPAERDKRMRRLGRHLMQGVAIEALTKRGFSWREIDEARKRWNIPLRTSSRSKKEAAHP